MSELAGEPGRGRDDAGAEASLSSVPAPAPADASAIDVVGRVEFHQEVGALHGSINRSRHIMLAELRCEAGWFMAMLGAFLVGWGYSLWREGMEEAP